MNVSWDLSYDVIGSSGRVYEQMWQVIPDEVKFDGEIYNGGEITGAVLYELSKTERVDMIRVKELWNFSVDYIFLEAPAAQPMP